MSNNSSSFASQRWLNRVLCVGFITEETKAKLVVSVRQRDMLLQQYRELRDQVQQQLATRATMPVLKDQRSEPTPQESKDESSKLSDDSSAADRAAGLRSNMPVSARQKLEFVRTPATHAAVVSSPAGKSGSLSTAAQHTLRASDHVEAVEDTAASDELQQLKQTIHARAEDMRQRLACVLGLPVCVLLTGVVTLDL